MVGIVARTFPSYLHYPHGTDLVRAFPADGPREQVGSGRRKPSLRMGSDGGPGLSDQALGGDWIEGVTSQTSYWHFKLLSRLSRSQCRIALRRTHAQE